MFITEIRSVLEQTQFLQAVIHIHCENVTPWVRHVMTGCCDEPTLALGLFHKTCNNKINKRTPHPEGGIFRKHVSEGVIAHSFLTLLKTK